MKEYIRTHVVYGIFYNKMINNFYLEHNESKMPQHKFEYNASVGNIYVFENSIQFVVSTVFTKYDETSSKRIFHIFKNKEWFFV